MRRYRLQFPLRALLALMLAVGCFFGGRASRDADVERVQATAEAQQRRAVSALRVRQAALENAVFQSIPVYACGEAYCAVDATITAIGKQGLAEIDAGHSDGLREGMMLEVERDAEFVGLVTVRRVAPGRAVVEDLGVSLGPLGRGDRVHNRALQDRGP